MIIIIFIIIIISSSINDNNYIRTIVVFKCHILAISISRTLYQYYKILTGISFHFNCFLSKHTLLFSWQKGTTNIRYNNKCY